MPKFVRVRIERADGTHFHTTVTADHAVVHGLTKVGGRPVGRDGTPIPAKQHKPLGAPTAPAGGTATTTTEE